MRIIKSESETEERKDSLSLCLQVKRVVLAIKTEKGKELNSSKWKMSKQWILFNRIRKRMRF